jgi:hypothetical protein
MWEYEEKPYEVTEYESYNGWTHKYKEPRNIVRHRIVRKGKTNRELETIVEYETIARSKNYKKTRDNFIKIVTAVNHQERELNGF